MKQLAYIFFSSNYSSIHLKLCWLRPGAVERPSCYWLGRGSTSIVDPSKASTVIVEDHCNIRIPFQTFTITMNPVAVTTRPSTTTTTTTGDVTNVPMTSLANYSEDLMKNQKSPKPISRLGVNVINKFQSSHVIKIKHSYRLRSIDLQQPIRVLYLSIM